MAWPALLVMGLAQLYLSDYQSRKARTELQRAQKQSEELWEEHAYPSEEAVIAGRKAGKTTLALAREEAEKRIPTSLAARGFGPGSQIMGGEYTELEKGYLQTLGKFETDITKWAESPNMPMPSAAFPTGEYWDPTQGLQTALGMMTAMSMYQGIYGGGGGGEYGAYNPYLQYDGFSGDLTTPAQSPPYLDYKG